MSDTCNSRHFSWLIKSCIPNSNSLSTPSFNPIISISTSLSSLPDDLLLECLTRVPSSSLPSLSAVCRRWSHLLRSPSFLSLRRLHGLIHPTVFAFSTSDHSSLSAVSLRFTNRRIAIHTVSKIDTHISIDDISHSRLAAIGPHIYIITPNGLVFCYDTWTLTLTLRSSITFPRKKFAAAVVSGKIYVAGGGSRAAAAMEEYDPETDSWSVIAQCSRKRFGCTGAGVDGVFYVIGGLKITTTGDAHVYASSMDLYDVEARVWLRSRTLPGGGCVVAACSAAGFVYILASHAVELSFWRFDARRGKNNSSGAFGEWCRIKSPPLPVQVRLDSTVRFSCVGVEDKVVLIQVAGRNVRGLKEGLVLVYDSGRGEWSRGPDLPEVIRRAACVAAEC
ncbi:Galactose oxidase/kelch repeat superfamily protein [Euphorbia peplus]|nr:Galactose oxidase/kelch repeat superfamily protein [Euphorbia peplus]